VALKLSPMYPVYFVTYVPGLNPSITATVSFRFTSAATITGAITSTTTIAATWP